MPKLQIEFDLPDNTVVMSDTGTLYISLANGVTMKTKAPKWVQSVKSAKLVLEMEVLGSPSDDNTRSTPVS